MRRESGTGASRSPGSRYGPRGWRRRHRCGVPASGIRAGRPGSGGVLVSCVHGFPHVIGDASPSAAPSDRPFQPAAGDTYGHRDIADPCGGRRTGVDRILHRRRRRHLHAAASVSGHQPKRDVLRSAPGGRHDSLPLRGATNPLQRGAQSRRLAVQVELKIDGAYTTRTRMVDPSVKTAERGSLSYIPGHNESSAAREFLPSQP